MRAAYCTSPQGVQSEKMALPDLSCISPGKPWIKYVPEAKNLVTMILARGA